MKKDIFVPGCPTLIVLISLSFCLLFSGCFSSSNNQNNTDYSEEYLTSADEEYATIGDEEYITIDEEEIIDDDDIAYSIIDGDTLYYYNNGNPSIRPVVEDDYEINDTKHFVMYSSFFMLPRYATINAYNYCSKYYISKENYGTIVTVTSAETGNAITYEICQKLQPDTDDSYYKAVGRDKYLRWRSDDSGMVEFDDLPGSKSMTACVKYYFASLDEAESSRSNFPTVQSTTVSGYNETASYGSSSYSDETSSSSTSGVCPDCGGKGYRPQAYEYAATNNAYHNFEDNTCPICFLKYDHYHYRCTTCKRL